MIFWLKFICLIFLAVVLYTEKEKQSSNSWTVLLCVWAYWCYGLWSEVGF